MITPRFECSQTAESVVIKIYCPSVRAADVEIHVDDTLLTIHINPYFLRLNFSHPLLEDDESSAQYDPSSGYMTVTLTKETKGQEFADLDLLAKLLAPRPSKEAPSIEVIGEQYEDEADELVARTNALSLEQEEILIAAENDWQLPQQVPTSDPPITTSITQSYGFLNRYSGYFKHVTHTENEINELGPDPEACLVQERRSRRWKHEDEKWDEEHYMADYADDEYIQELISWVNPRIVSDGPFAFTEEENLTLLNLPRREYLSDAHQTKNLYITLATILFAYAYEARTTQGDSTPESAWTLCSLTPAFSALDPAPYTTTSNWESELAACLYQSYRRSLAFPLFRSFSLAEACRVDVAELFSRGKRAITRCLLEIKRILDHHEVYYVYSKIWVEDFCVWVQASASDDVLKEIGEALRGLRIEKAAIGWDLEVLEAATRDAEDRESDSDDESEEEVEVARQL
ncbi:SHQ1 protein-domain-containing protein [Roridomyces roridus]|uniref:SHQ1 protein-domain-containing protein n=1 Tax=Roridomyces roridus TaxID=1738132 RepID=A0AAD7F976_9AGAR|nr:SHQ1 protein-domain-containing protein [Roridomyces roridus]